MTWSEETDRFHVFNEHVFEFVPKEVFEVLSFLVGSDGTTHGVALLDESFDDVDSEEPGGTSDKNFSGS